MTDWLRRSIVNTVIGIATFSVFSYLQDLKSFWLYSNHYTHDKMDTTGSTSTPQQDTIYFQSTNQHTQNMFESIFIMFLQYKNVLLLYGFLGGLIMSIFATGTIVTAIKLYQCSTQSESFKPLWIHQRSTTTQST